MAVIDLPNEEWRVVKDFPLYFISNRGRLKKVDGEERIVSVKNSKGWYLTIPLTHKKKRKTCRIHKLVYEAFLGDIPEGCHVHHIDGSKQNNNVENLFLFSKSDHLSIHSSDPQTYYAMNQYNKNRAIHVLQYSLDGKFIAEYASAKEASLATGVCERNIHQVCSKTEFSPGRCRKQAGGYIWRKKE